MGTSKEGEMKQYVIRSFSPSEPLVTFVVNAEADPLAILKDSKISIGVLMNRLIKNRLQENEFSPAVKHYFGGRNK